MDADDALLHHIFRESLAIDFLCTAPQSPHSHLFERQLLISNTRTPQTSFRRQSLHLVVMDLQGTPIGTSTGGAKVGGDPTLKLLSFPLVVLTPRKNPKLIGAIRSNRTLWAITTPGRKEQDPLLLILLPLSPHAKEEVSARIVVPNLLVSKGALPPLPILTLQELPFLRQLGMQKNVMTILPRMKYPTI